MSNYRLICLGTRPSPYATRTGRRAYQAASGKSNHTAHTVQKVCVRRVGKSSPMLFSTSDHVLQVRGMLRNASLQTEAADFERRRFFDAARPGKGKELLKPCFLCHRHFGSLTESI